MTQDTKNDAKNIFIPQWTEDKWFTSGSVIVIVKRSNHWRPRYSYEIVFTARDKPSRYCFVRSTGDGTGKIGIEANSTSLGLAAQEAEGYIRDRYQWYEDEQIERKADKERAALNRDRPVTKPGLKELSKRDKAARSV